MLSAGGPGWVGGIVYSHNLLRALGRLPDAERPEVELLLGPRQRAGDHCDLAAAMPPHRQFAFRRAAPLPRRIAGTAVSLAAGRWPQAFERQLADGRFDAVFPALMPLGRHLPVPWIGWIPDFQHCWLPQYFTAAERQIRDRAYARLVEEAPHLVVSSRSAHADLMRWFPVAPARVTVLPFTAMAAAEWYAEEPPAVVRAYGLPERFLIFPSQFWAHKNHQVAFEAIRLLRERGIDDICLVCTGATHDYRRPEVFRQHQAFVQRHSLASNIRILGLLPRARQVQLLRAAVAVVQPSRFEGWSALVEDARAFGKRLYLSDIPVHREQNPPDAEFFEPGDAAGLADLVGRDWNDLRAGPDHRREAQARREQEARGLAFARAFLAVVDRVRGGGSSSREIER